MQKILNKRKIINDPIYGFITIPDELIYDLINHPYFQRLRRIKQLGMTNLVYPGALHTRFHHAIGAMWLMVEAIKVLQSKGVEISKEEEQKALSLPFYYTILATTFLCTRAHDSSWYQSRGYFRNADE